MIKDRACINGKTLVKCLGCVCVCVCVLFPGQREMESNSGPDSLKDCAAFAAA